MAGEVKASDLLLVARAIDSLPDSVTLADGPEWVFREVLRHCVDRELAELARSIVRMTVRAAGRATGSRIL
jgi:hypothetical protein